MDTGRVCRAAKNEQEDSFTQPERASFALRQTT